MIMAESTEGRNSWQSRAAGLPVARPPSTSNIGGSGNVAGSSSSSQMHAFGTRPLGLVAKGTAAGKVAGGGAPSFAATRLSGFFASTSPAPAPWPATGDSDAFTGSGPAAVGAEAPRGYGRVHSDPLQARGSGGEADAAAVTAASLSSGPTAGTGGPPHRAPVVRWTPPWMQHADAARRVAGPGTGPSSAFGAASPATIPSYGGGGVGSGGGGGRPTPMLTLILLRLDGALVRFCEELSNPSASGAAAAAKALDGMRTFSSPTLSSSGGGPPIETPPSLSSPGRHGRDRAGTSASDEVASVGSSRSAHSSPGPMRKLSSSPDPSPDPSPAGPEARDASKFGVQPPPMVLLPQTVAFSTTSSPGPGGRSSRGGGALLRRHRPRSSSSSPPSSSGRARKTSPMSRWRRKRNVGGGAASASFLGVDPAFGSEWDRFAAPFTLLAGAEALYAQLEHVANSRCVNVGAGEAGAKVEGRGTLLGRMRAGAKSHGSGGGDGVGGSSVSPVRGRSGWSATSSKENNSLEGSPGARSHARSRNNGSQQKQQQANRSDRGMSRKLLDMYSKARKDLTIVSEILCDPIVGALSPRDGDEEEAFNPSQQQQPHQAMRLDPSLRAARSLAATVVSLNALIDARQELISIHLELVLGPNARALNRGGSPSEAASAADPSEEGGIDPGTGAGFWYSGVPSDDGEDDDGCEAPTLLSLSERCDLLLKTLPDPQAGAAQDAPVVEVPRAHFGSARPMIDNLRCEIGATSAMLAASYFLNRCCFYETVLSVKRLKQHINSSALPSAPLLSPVRTWIRSALIHILTIMPIFFDRVDAYSSSVFGFQRHNLAEDTSAQLNPGALPSIASVGTNSSQKSLSSSVSASRQSKQPKKIGAMTDNLDAIVLEVLRKHEQRNGAPLALAVVFEGGSGSAPTFEQGFMCGQDEKKDDDSTHLNSFYDDHTVSPLRRVYGLQSWPAVYLRTTLQSGASLSEHTPSGFGVSSLRRPKHHGSRGSIPSFSQILKGDNTTQMHGGTSQGGGLSQRSSQVSFPTRGASLKTIHVDGNDDKSQLAISPVVNRPNIGCPLGIGPGLI
uniref:Uncharacterized protein n=1 Tax=Odontella aurita TaxID=265563 RepID=A0A7S4IUY8_9STRA|mmetsp:Transcript_3070/g.8001  ORF Transcript_3070/g.8001 Transcript_3070/m.8001 type:complete len:1074 (+) Transcript_3070:175-3396(+)